MAPSTVAALAALPAPEIDPHSAGAPRQTRPTPSQQRVRAHRPLALPPRLRRAHLRLGHLRSAGDPTVAAHGSTIVGDKFGSPDGLYVAPNDRLWIQTDVSTSTINAGAYAGPGNNQMLAADAGTKEIRRFLIGPKHCEITGVFMTPDARTMFVGIQHPGERPDDAPGNPANPTEFPGGPGSSRPRSSLLVVTKMNADQIGS